MRKTINIPHMSDNADCFNFVYHNICIYNSLFLYDSDLDKRGHTLESGNQTPISQ